MPIPIPAPTPSPEPALPARRLYVRDQQDFALENERLRQNQAIYLYGEYVMFILMWHIQDLESGRITRCTECYGNGQNNCSEEVYNEGLDECDAGYGDSAQVQRPSSSTLKAPTQPLLLGKKIR